MREPARTATCTAPTSVSVPAPTCGAGGFPDVPTGEDQAFVAALTAGGSRVCLTRALPVVTSARRDARAPHGFSGYLAELDAEAGAALA